MALTLNYSASSLSTNMDRMGTKLGASSLCTLQPKLAKLKAKMKVGRPWTDRTGMAKAMLSAKVSQPSSDVVRITLAHGVNYGIWLELANEKNYAIIGPTIREESPRIVTDLGDIMSQLRL